MDSAAEGETCVAHNTGYNDADINFMDNPSDEDVLNACKASNGGVVNCAVRTCTIEVAFLRDWWPIQQQTFSGQFDAEVSRYSHASFDYRSVRKIFVKVLKLKNGDICPYFSLFDSFLIIF